LIFLVENYGKPFRPSALQHHLTVRTQGTTNQADHSAGATANGQQQLLRNKDKVRRNHPILHISPSVSRKLLRNMQSQKLHPHLFV